MKLKVPFVRGLKKWKGKGWCGPLSLASVLRYYDDKTPVEELVRLANTGVNGGTVPQGIINICLNKGMKVNYFDEEEYEKEDNPNYSEQMKSFLRNIKAEKNEKYFYELNKNNPCFNFIKRKASISDILEFLNQGVPVLIVHNASVIFGEDKLFSHYIVVVGYDEDNFYIHNTARGNHRFQKVDKELLEKSWDCGGINHVLIAIEK